ncbi:hypothetical protein BDD12DRAFT_880663 [Trichophaea hybrida]|nr:hypothetical protein BDD12DRAFT_880663 [Trichophaea hybrida]
MSSKKSSRMLLPITDRSETDDTLQAAASAAKCASLMVSPQAEIDHEVDKGEKDSNGYFNPQGNGDGDDTSDLCSQITDGDHHYVTAQNCLMLEIVFEYQVQ